MPILDRQRRIQLVVTVAIASAACFFCWRTRIRSGPEANQLVVVSYGGGAWQDTHKKVFIGPFAAITGIDVTSVSWNAEYSKLKNDVASSNVPWDVVEVTSSIFDLGKKENLFERLDESLDPTQFVEGAIDPYGIANVYWATVVAFDSKRYPQSPPLSWRDFWDIGRFPGPRALYDDPRGNLEFALLADGVQPRDLYPLDVDRAFKSLDRIKPSVRVWWNDGSQPIQLLVSGQVVMSSAWNGRLFAARNDAPGLQWSWDGAAIDLAWWVVPRGSKSVEVAKRFIWFASQPYPLAQQAQVVGYGPSNKESLKYVSSAVQKMLPTEEMNRAAGFAVRADWWSDHEVELQKRWLLWKSQ
jgi:putative spermidine/putrescine transport system substrate-binding protein